MRLWFNRYLLPAALLAGALLAGGTLLFSWYHAMERGQSVPAELQGMMLPASRALEPFQLVDHKGAPFTLDNLRGQWSLVFFGYTYCPDICPLGLGVLSAMLTDLSSRNPSLRQRSRGIFISVDPQRDTPKVLQDYVAFFGSDLLGVTGTAEQLQDAARKFGAYFRIQKEKPVDTDYEVVHSSSVLLISPQAHLVAMLDPKLVSGEKMADQFMRIVKSLEKESRP
ncbi:MAG: SCO family protein [Magnetococcales bacterium]|nr:SCO family protein [Magnetococcales bacterium]